MILARVAPGTTLFALWLLAAGCGSREKFSDADSDSDADTDTDTGPETCGEVGASRQDECGCYQICAEDQTWHDDGPCTRECSPGEIETTICGTYGCGTQQRLCGRSCLWNAPSVCDELPREELECVPGDILSVDREGCGDGEISSLACDSSCHIVDTSCSWECPGVPRGVGTDSEEVCVPGGPFIMGGADETDSDDDPEHEVVLSPFFIGRYEVTNERYVACMDAGQCPDIYWGEIDRAATLVTWGQSGAFCAFIGGRLPTEAEWEKTARGAAPDRRRYPWGDDPATCEQNYSPGCDDSHATEIDAYPAGASPFGAERLMTTPIQWTNDLYDPGYYAVSPSVDPRGPDTNADGRRSVRGVDTFFFAAEDLPPLTDRSAFPPASDVAEEHATIRCVRTGEE
jgi:hypothetical protein